jgi:plastocyanin
MKAAGVGAVYRLGSLIAGCLVTLAHHFGTS